MKPILLEFAGLNSYRDAQRVDFEHLMGGGLFGIFGPTGSGKSTILDAITLALYGTVDRADRNTQGIMNQGESQLWVKFTFALASPGAEERFRVERSFKRADEVAVRAGISRLVALTPAGEMVLADRPSDVTAKVQEILGLRVEDFTRAVVLPQGKFAQFLHSEPRERREMLQRLFALHQYGDKLLQRLKASLTDVDGRHKLVEGEQAGLGDASEGAVATAAARLAGATEAVATADAALQAAEQEHRTWERVWALQQERTTLEGALARWRSQEPEADGKRTELQTALRAEQVRPALAAHGEALSGDRTAAERLAVAIAGQATALHAEREAADTYAVAHASRGEEEPGLIGRQVRLKQAVALEADVRTRQARAAELGATVARDRVQYQQAQTALANLAEQAARVQADQGKALERLAAAQVDAEQRERVKQALVALRASREADAALAQAERRAVGRAAELAVALAAAARADAVRQEAEAKLTAHEAARSALEAEPPAQEADLRAEGEWLVRADEAVRAVQSAEADLAQGRTELTAAETDAARLGLELTWADAAEAGAQAAVEQARARLEAAKANLETERHRNMAGTLAASLNPGDPCPVCGATAHPQPATSESQAAVEAAQAQVAAAESALREAERAAQQASRQGAEARGLAGGADARALAACQAEAQASERLKAARGKLPDPWRESVVERLPALVATEREENGRKRRLWEEWQAQVERMRRTREELVRTASAAAAAASSADATAQARNKTVDEAAVEQTVAGEAAVLRRTELDRVRGEMTPEALEAEDRRIAALDKQAGALQKQLRELSERREQVDRSQREQQARGQQLADALKELEQQHAVLSEQLRGNVAELRNLTGGEPAAPQLAAAEARLKALETLEAQAKAAAEGASAKRNAAEAALAAAQREQDLAAQRQEQADAALAEGLQAAGFADAASAESGFRSAARRQEIEAWLREQERQGDLLRHKQAELAQELAGRSLEPEAWSACQARLGEAKAALESSREERSRAAQVHDDLTAKHARWTELERDRRALATRQSNLNDLQALLRGNALVEFLAEGQLTQVAREASERLGQLTKHRYALEIDSGGGFVIRDDYSGGLRRPVSTLSGGETFLSSLALALTLSAQIQLRGRHPLEFFFLDEGFGTLDPDLLTLVIDTLEKLHFEKLHVGIISHVPELRARLQRKLVVESAEPGGQGSRLTLEVN